ncbi:hypothetical protein EV361DRAFT_868663 [Lentinula raphanica]|nr:hypothetical protein EV361DRAFT_868663 [Lentinula raphanica]
MAVPLPAHASSRDSITLSFIPLLSKKSWRLQLGSRTIIEPSEVADNEWILKCKDLTSNRGTGENSVELGKFQGTPGLRFSESDRHELKVGIDKQRAGSPTALLESLMVSLSPELFSTAQSDSTAQHDPTTRLKLPSGVTFTATRSESDRYNDAWAILLDSKNLESMVFLEKYGRARSNWIQVLGTQGRKFREELQAVEKAAAEKAAAEKAAAEKAAKEEEAERAAKETSSSTTAGSMLSVAQMLN